MKKLLALVLALAMLFTVGLAFANEPVTEPNGGDDSGENQPAATDYDYPITVTGLAEGDSVTFYKVIEWVGETTDKSDVSGWKAVAPFADYLNKAKLTEILLGNTSAEPVVAPTGITSAIAGDLAALIGTTAGVAGTVANGTATLQNASSGMWMGIITPADANTIYNPVFVSADYNKDAAGTVAATGAFADAVAKKTELTLTKTASTTEDTWDDSKPNTTAIGDTVSFTVTTTIPGYGEVYDNPHFVLKDVLTALAYDTGSVAVTGLTKDTDYTVSDESASGYTITFAKDYLKGIKTATEVTVTYTAKVTTDAAYAVNEETNEVMIEYSHNPTDESDYDVKKDTTQHYTFTIDAAAAGSGQSVSGKKTSEIVKVSVKPDGTPEYERTETSAITSTEKWQSPLAGAVFGLFTDAECKNAYIPKNAKGESTGTALTATTLEDGRMTFAGLDAGTYYLKEISAPAGYVTNSEIVKVEITATFKSVKVTEWWNGSAWVSTKPTSGTAKEVTYDTDIIEKYTVKVGDTDAATYTFNNPTEANGNEINWEIAETVEKPHQFKNTRGVELPSTGGIGTTLFYVIGGMLLVGAAVILVARRKAEN